MIMTWVQILVVAASALCVPVRAQPMEREITPSAVVDALTNGDMEGSDERRVALRERIVKSPSVFAPLIAERSKLPEKASDLDAPDEDTRHRLQRIPAVIALVPHLGKEKTEPLLKRTFEDAAKLFRRSMPEYEAAVADWKRRGGWQGAGSAADRADCIRLGNRMAYLGSVMSAAIKAADEMASGVLVDGILELYEAGVDPQQGAAWPNYVLKFAEVRPDVLRRVEALAAKPSTSRNLKWLLEQALEMRRKQFAEKEAVEERAHAQGDSSLRSAGRP
jgi:hypothetical protein